MNEANGPLLTIDEMARVFHGKWVLVVEPELDAHHELLRGRVAFQAEGRDAVDRKVVELRPNLWSVRFLGPWPEDVGYLL